MFAELKCKTNFSFLRGASHPEQLIAYAYKMGLSALAINDNDGVYGLPKAHARVLQLKEESLKLGEPPRDFKLIISSELTLGGHPPITLLCKNKSGYALMCRMITQGHADQPKGHARLDWDDFVHMMCEPGREGLIALVDPNWNPELEINMLYDDDRKVLAQSQKHQYETLKDLFNKDLYLLLSRHLDGHDKARTKTADHISELYDIPIIATNDVHYHRPERRVLHDVLTANRHLLPLTEAGRKLYSNAERHLKSPEEMARLFHDRPEALARTIMISEQCTFSLKELKYLYPREWIPRGETAQGFLDHLTREGAQKYFPQGVPEKVQKQIDQELDLISKKNFADYFLTVWHIVDYARGQKILCQGRGSAANSAVCYCLGITAVDPTRVDLLFERFLSMEREEPPDIDVDFEHERREEVIQYIYETYGRHRAAMVSAVVTYKDRGARRDIKRAFGLDLEAPEPAHLTKTFDRLSEALYGSPRHVSIHSGGFVLSHEPLTNIVPVEPARMEGRTIVQWDKYDLDILGLLKVDVLSLGMLTAIRKSLQLIGRELHEIPAEDEPTYEMIRRGDSVGTFQIESRAQMNMLGRLRPKTFYDLVIQVAIVRPGPIVGKMVHPYLKRRHGLEKEDYPHPDLIPILKKTLGVPLFQEQVMKMAIVLADFTAGEADRLRRAIGAWRSNGTIEEMGRKLMKGLLAKGLPQEWVQRVFDQIKGFSEYGFPESHAASFALLAYASSWLKRHHQAEFTCSLVNSQPMGFYSTHSLIEDAKRAGVKILPIDPNISEWDCTIERGARAGAAAASNEREARQPEYPFAQSWSSEQRADGQQRAKGHTGSRADRQSGTGQPGNQAARQSGNCAETATATATETETATALRSELRLGFRIIKGIREPDVEELLRERTKRPFSSLFDFLSRTNFRQDVLFRFAMGDVFLAFGYEQRDALWQVLAHQALLRDKRGEQLNLFAEIGQTGNQADGQTGSQENEPSFDRPTDFDRISHDYDSYGLSLKGHPMEIIRKTFRGVASLTVEQIRAQAKHGKIVQVSGLVIARQRPPTAKGTVFATLEDETGLLDLIFHKSVFEKYESVIRSSAFLTAEGALQQEGWSVSVLVQKLTTPLPPQEKVRKQVRAPGSYF